MQGSAPSTLKQQQQQLPTNKAHRRACPWAAASEPREEGPALAAASGAAPREVVRLQPGHRRVKPQQAVRRAPMAAEAARTSAEAARAAALRQCKAEQPLWQSQRQQQGAIDTRRTPAPGMGICCGIPPGGGA